MGVFDNPNFFRISIVVFENFSISLAENCFSIISKLEIEKIRHMGNRDKKKTLGTVIPSAILFPKVRLPAASRGSVGISPTLA